MRRYVQSATILYSTKKTKFLSSKIAIPHDFTTFYKRNNPKLLYFHDIDSITFKFISIFRNQICRPKVILEISLLILCSDGISSLVNASASASIQVHVRRNHTMERMRRTVNRNEVHSRWRQVNFPQMKHFESEDIIRTAFVREA